MNFTGSHIIGRGRARTLGFPTINLHNINTIAVEDGVYAARVTINAVRFIAAMFVGESPTFNDKEKTIELHLVGLTEEDIKKYHLDSFITTKISVETIQYLRPVKKFASRKELIQRIKENVDEVISLFKATSLSL